MACLSALTTSTPRDRAARIRARPVEASEMASTRMSGSRASRAAGSWTARPAGMTVSRGRAESRTSTPTTSNRGSARRRGSRPPPTTPHPARATRSTRAGPGTFRPGMVSGPGTRVTPAPSTADPDTGWRAMTPIASRAPDRRAAAAGPPQATATTRRPRRTSR